MSSKKTCRPSQSQSDQGKPSHLAIELALLEGQRLLALERRQLIQQGVAPLRRFSRSSVNEAELSQEALAELDKYLTSLDLLITQKRLALEIVTSTQ